MSLIWHQKSALGAIVHKIQNRLQIHKTLCHECAHWLELAQFILNQLNTISWRIKQYSILSISLENLAHHDKHKFSWEVIS